MLSIQNKYLLFLSSSAVILLSGITIRVDAYENNQLLNLNNSHSKIVISQETYDKINPQEGKWFQYYENGQEFNKQISSVQNIDNKWLVILSNTNKIEPITNIYYKTHKTSLWKEIISYESSRA